MQGISVIICCFNSARRIANTLRAIALQSFPMKELEVILVDNNSSDNTVQCAWSVWKSLKPKWPLTVVIEKNPGLSFARKKGIFTSKYDYVVFVDDDNELNSDYLMKAFTIMINNNTIGACGGQCFLPKEYIISSLPDWWKNFESAFAIGSPARSKGKVSYVWGAGMCINKKAFELIIGKGFDFILTGRKGYEQTSGEDSELCFALRMLDYIIYYDPELQLVHRIDKKRFSENYIMELMLGFGKSLVYLGIYKNILRFGTSRKWIEMIISYGLIIISAITYLNPYIAKTEKKLNYIKNKNRLWEIRSISEKEYNLFVSRILRLTD